MTDALRNGTETEMEQRLVNEIEHGRFLAQSGAGEIWNWTSPAGVLRWRRRVAMLCEGLHSGDRVLEVGCGTGYFTKEIARTDADITAVDLSPDLLDLARAEVTAPNVRFLAENAYQTTFADGSFDHVVGSSVLHHLDPKQALKEVFRLLRSGGTLRFTEPNMLNPQIAVQKNVPAIKKRLGDSPDETAFVRWSLGRELAAHGFTGIKITPFDFLHPKTPPAFIPFVEKLGGWLERTPGLREIAGSLFIRARKP